MGVFGGIHGGRVLEEFSPFYGRAQMRNARSTALGTVAGATAFSSGKAFASIGYAEREMRVQGIGVPLTTAFSSGNIKFNMGLYTAVAATNSPSSLAVISPGALIDPNGWGELTANSTVSGQRMLTLSFQDTIVLPRGPFLFAGAYQNNSAAGAVFEGTSIVRCDGALNTEAQGYKRYDLISTTAPTYESTDMSATIVGLTWEDAGLIATAPQNINWHLWLDES